MAETSGHIFKSEVEHQNKPCKLVLSQFELSWKCKSHSDVRSGHVTEPLTGKQKHESCLDLREVIGVRPITVPPKHSTLSLKRKSRHLQEDAFAGFEMNPLGPIGFSVFVISRSGGFKWRPKQICFHCKDRTLCQNWITKIKQALNNPVFNRPKHLVVFVNPFSGKNKAVKLYKEKVLPLFELADIKVDLHETQRQNHARDLVQDTLDLSQTDGLISVGGDGLYSELLNGLLTRVARENDIAELDDFTPVSPEIRIGLIPAGSTNTIVFTTTGVADVVTSTLHIILGDSLGIDVNSVNVNDQFIRYSVTLLGYGYMGDLLKDSENNRWMGPKRYDWSGTKKFLANNSYYGEVKFKLSPDDESHPTNGVKCYSGCETCFSGNDNTTGSSDINLLGLDIDNTSSTEDDSILDVNDGSVQTVIGKFVAVNSVTMSCSCDLSPPGMSPYCHLGDGCMDLILVSDCSRTDFLKFLLRTAKGEERHSLDFIQMFRVTEFSFRPLSEHSESDIDSISGTSEISHSQRTKLKRQTSKTSVWNCDGEVIPNPKIKVRVHRQLIKLFARGIEDPNNHNLDDSRCQMCCSPV